MATIKVHAGDFPKGNATFMFGSITFPWQPGDGLTGKSVSAGTIQAIEIATEQSVKRLGGTVGWGAVGGLLLGPVGLLAGLLAGGRGKDVTFVTSFRDGRRMLASTDSGTYKKLLAKTFR